MAKKLTEAQKKGLAKGRRLMADAIAWQKEGGSHQVTSRKFERNTKDYLKNHKKRR